MRQIGEEYAYDPFKPISTAPVEAPVMTAQLKSEHQAWTRNTYAEAAHRFCTSAARINLSTKEFDAQEDTRFSNCLAKYATSFTMFSQEKQHFQKRCDDMAAVGQSKFAHLNN